ncbi:hypothetical protein ACFQ2B_13000 [Streptomyces stramineus]
MRAGAIAAYRAGARAAAARAAVDGTPPPAATGSSTWGGGSAASGAAPAPAPWSADALLHGTSSGSPRRTGGPGPAPGAQRPRPVVPSTRAVRGLPRRRAFRLGVLRRPDLR